MRLCTVVRGPNGDATGVSPLRPSLRPSVRPRYAVRVNYSLTREESYGAHKSAQMFALSSRVEAIQ